MEKMNEIKRLKILVVFNSLLGAIGGASRHIIEVANYWNESCDVEFFISKSGYKTLDKYFKNKPGEIILYSTIFDNSKNRILAYTSRIIQNFLIAPEIKKSHDYDVIIAPNYLPQNMIPAIFFKKKNTKLIVYFHTVQPALRQSYFKNLNILQRYVSILNWNLCVFLARYYFDLIFVVNSSTRNYFIEKGFNKSKVIEIDNAITYKKIQNINQVNTEFDAIYLSRLTKRKGVYDLLRIWDIIIKKYPSAKLCIIGDGEEKDGLIKQIKDSNLKKNVILRLGVSDDEKFNLMKKSKIFLFPSYYEAKPIVVIEAFACGLPVVAYDLSVYKENYQNYVFSVEIGDIEAMADKTIDILEHIQDYELIIEESKMFASKFDWEIVAGQGLAYIKNIL